MKDNKYTRKRRKRNPFIHRRRNGSIYINPIVYITIMVVTVGVLIGVLYSVLGSKDKSTPIAESQSQGNTGGGFDSDLIAAKEDEIAKGTAADEAYVATGVEDGTTVDVATFSVPKGDSENNQTTMGIDVAKYQGTIDWAQVAGSGVQFAIIRVGLRDMTTGEIKEDSNARYNMQEATKNGIKIGAYFFSTAVSSAEAKEEADWVAGVISQYQITYPVAYNCEGFEKNTSRQYGMSVENRSQVAEAFLDEIAAKGYTPMFYASKNEMSSDLKWKASALEKKYKIWVAQYPTQEASAPAYAGLYSMWQYTNHGTVPGIKQSVDVDIASFGYDSTANAKSDIAPENAKADAEALMKFTDCNDKVTAKKQTNLRDIPSQGNDAKVIATISNGEVVSRTGTSTSGWSRVIYNNQTCYAVSSYLTTDIVTQTQIAPEASSKAEVSDSTLAGSGDGLKTKFTAVSEPVTAKIEVNLRTLPSVTNPDAKVVAVLHNGEVASRTGINNEYGWSRVEYNGQTLYCVSSYLKGAE